MQGLTAKAHALPADDDRTIDQARADLLVDTLLGRQDGGLGYRAVIGITVPLSSLMGFSDVPGELTDRSSTVPAHIVRAAMADESSLLYRLVTDDIGNLMTVSWLGRFAPARLNQVLEFRDGTSVFPTSSVPARHCDTDHSGSVAGRDQRGQHRSVEPSGAQPQDRGSSAAATNQARGLHLDHPHRAHLLTVTAAAPVADWQLDDVRPVDLAVDLPIDPGTDEFLEMLEALDALEAA